MSKANFGVGTLVYEVNQSTISGVAATQIQLDQIGASVGNALAVAEHILLMQRDSQLPDRSTPSPWPSLIPDTSATEVLKRRGDAIVGR